MRWALVHPRHVSSSYDPELQEPLGLQLLASVLVARGDDVFLLDAALEQQDEQRIGRRVAAFQPDAVGFSLMTYGGVESTLAICREARQAAPQLPNRWLAGGNFISTELHNARRLLPAEFTFVRFDGESVVAQLSDRFRAGQDFPMGQVLDGEPLEDLDALPFAVRPYADVLIASGQPVNLQASRGCCGQCKYCPSPGMSSDGVNRWRGRDIAVVVQEIAHVHRDTGARAFNIIDEDFLGPPSVARGRAALLAEQIKQRNLKISFGVQVRPHTLTEEIVNWLADSGLVFVFMGIESDDRDDFRRWGRPWSPAPFRPVDWLRQRRIGVNVGSLMFHSHSTPDKIRRFAQALHEHGLLNYRSAVNDLAAMPGSVYYQQAWADGLVTDQTLGPLTLAFQDSRVEQLRNQLVAALAPLGPTSMQAYCALPAIHAHVRFHPQETGLLDQLEAIMQRLDNAVADTFFALLDACSNDSPTDPVVERLREQNLAASLAGIHGLLDLGLASSFDQLREAVRLDSQL